MRKRLVLLVFVLLGLLGSAAQAQLNKHHFYYKGRELIMQRNYRGAIEMLNMLLISVPKDYEGYFLRGVAKYNLEDLMGAEADFTHAIAQNPVYTQAFQYRAITRSRMGNYTEALQDFQFAIELRPNAAPTYFSRGVAYFLSQQFERSVEDFSRYLRSNPKDISALTNRGTSYLYLRDTLSAYTDFNRAIEINPEDPDGFVRRGLLRVVQGDYTEGITDLSRAIGLDDRLAVAHFYRAIAYVNQEQPLAALGDFDRAIALDSTNSVAYFNRAILRSRIGDYNRAIADYDRVAQYNPGNVLVFYNRASVKAQMGDYRGAIRDYTQAIELYPDFANAYLLRSQLRSELNDVSGARRDWLTGEAKIEAYRRNLRDTAYSVYADTSARFDRLMTFDADFGRNELKSIGGRAEAGRDAQLLPMFRIALARRDTTLIYNPRDYRNARVDQYLSMLPLSTDGTEVADSSLVWQLSDQAPAGPLFEAVAALGGRWLAEYPLLYLNRSVAEAERIEFITSLEENRAMKQIVMGSEDDPASYLATGSAARRNYDYDSATDDARQLMELIPELPHAYYNMGNLLCLSGNMPGAYEHYTKAIELFPFFAEAYYNRGLVQIYLKDTQTGCLDLSKAGELGLELAYETLKRYCIKK